MMPARCPQCHQEVPVEPTCPTATAATSGEDATSSQLVPPFEAAPAAATTMLELDARNYRLAEPLGQGGMGEVYRAVDPALGRDLAVKVIKAAHRCNPSVEQRFVREARVTGSLQHPGIVPVYNLGRLVDGRLHYTMRLVHGQTFAEILAAEASQREGLPALLSIFEKICQAVAYAHSRHVIHRDLKPANVMVGRFGEVQVMDWGLAKVLTAEAAADGDEEANAAGTQTWMDGEETPVDLTRMGSGLGTLAYMPLEQAVGKWDVVDERADVFALGSILCQVLTGKPVYSGTDSNQVYLRAIRGDVSEAWERLQQCGADAVLVELCRQCLAPEREDRPRDAGVVADRMGQYQAEVQERLRRAELERVAAQTRAQEEQARAAVEQARTREALARAKAERRARQRMRALVLAVLAILCLGIGAGWWIVREREELAKETVERMESVARANEASTCYMRAELLYNKGRLEEALPEYRKCTELEPGTPEYWDALANVLYEARRYEEAIPAYEVVLRLKPTYAIAHHNLGDALQKAGQVDRAIAAYQEASRLEPDYAEAYDDLGDCLRSKGRLDEALAAYRKAIEVNPKLASPHGGLAHVFDDRGRIDEAMVEYGKAIRLKPEEASFHNNLALMLQKKGRLEEARAEYRLATRLEPEEPIYHKNLGNCLRKEGRLEEALTEYREAIRLEPGYADAHSALGYALESKGQLDQAIREYQDAIRLKPDVPLYRTNLASCLRKKGRREEALAACREALRIQPDYAEAHNGLGNLLDDQGRIDEAIAEYEKAIRQSPQTAVYPSNLGLSLRKKGRLDEAIAAYRKSLQLDADYANAHNGLGIALDGKDCLDEAIGEYRRAIQLDPREAAYHNNLGNSLRKQDRLDEALTQYRRAIQLKPDYASPHNGLALILESRGRVAEALAEYRQAIRLEPGNPIHQSNLGQCLLLQGDYAGARECWKTALRHSPRGNSDYAWHIQRCERYLGLMGKLPGVLAGGELPADAADMLSLAEMCWHKKHHATAARLFAAAFAADPELVNHPHYSPRYNAACSAALAAASGAEDGHPLPDRVVCMLRRWALDWLRAQLGSYVQRVEQKEAGVRPLVRGKLGLWRRDFDLVSVRDGSALGRLPDNERAAWQALWRDVDELAKRVTGDASRRQ